MRYILTPITKAQDFGISLKGHKLVRDKVILNEKELLFTESLSTYNDLESKAQALNGTVLTSIQTINIIRNE